MMRCVFAATLLCLPVRLAGCSPGTAVISFITKETSKVRSFHFSERYQCELICDAFIPVAVNYYNASLEFEKGALKLGNLL